MQKQLPYERVSIDSLVLDPENVRTHDRRNIDVIKYSLKNFKQQKPIVVTKDNIVIAGNGTLIAVKELRDETGDDYWNEIDISRSHLTGDEAAAYAAVDNRSTDLSKNDDEKLKDLLDRLKASEWDIEGLGWNDYDLSALGLISPDFEPGTEDDQGKLDEKKKVTCPECDHVFTP